MLRMMEQPIYRRLRKRYCECRWSRNCVQVYKANLLWRPCLLLLVVYIIISVLHVRDITDFTHQAIQTVDSCRKNRCASLRTFSKVIEHHFVAPDDQYGHCKPHSPSSEDIKHFSRVDEIGYQPCTEGKDNVICILPNGNSLNVSCKANCELYTLVYFDTTREAIVQRTADCSKKLEDVLTLLLKQDNKHVFPVMAVKCVSNNVSTFQVFIIEASDDRFLNTAPATTDGESLNCSLQPSIALIYIEALSRFDAFRTMPLTTALLKKSKSKSNDWESYDFHLLQSMARTRVDTLTSIINFDGDFPWNARSKLNDIIDRPLRQVSTPLHIVLEAQGFDQFWFGDICPINEQSLNSIFRNGSHRDGLEQWTFDAHRMLCDVITTTCSQETNVTNCLHKLRPSVQNAALHLSVRLQHDSFSPSFSLVNISFHALHSNSERHELDTSLSQYITLFMTLKCGLVFILSGHGDFFSELSYSLPFGTIAASNPFFAITMSKELNYIFGLNPVVFEENTRRLITIHDIAETIREVLCSMDSKEKSAVVTETCDRQSGLWTSLARPINMDRTCSTLGVPEPHMCVCNGESSFFRNDTINVAYAEYAIGAINRVIQDRTVRRNNLTSLNRNPFGMCQKIRGFKFDNVEILKVNDTIKITLDIWVLPSHTSEAPPLVMSEQYKVTMRQAHAHQGKSVISLLDLMDVNRITYNWHSVECQDHDVHSEYCLCDPTGNQTRQFTSFRPKDMLKVLLKRSFGVLPYILNLHHGCLLLALRDYNQTIAFEATNLCQDKVYRLRFHLYTRNMISSSGLAVETTTLLPFRYYFIGFSRQASYALSNKKIVYKPVIGLSKRECTAADCPTQ